MSAQSVSSADFVRRFGSWQDRISADPLFVTHHGRRRLVMLSAASYDRLVGEAPVAAAEDGGDEGGLAIRHETLLDQLDAGFVAFDPNLRLVAINPAACNHFRTTRAAAAGRSIDEACPDLADSVARGHLARAIATGEVAQVDLPSIAYPGSWLRLRIFPHGTGAACLLRNVSGEQEMRRITDSAAALRAALGADGTIGLGQLSLRATFCDLDATLARLAGFVRASLMQVRLIDILPLGRRVAAAAAIESVLAGGAPTAFDTALLVNNGEERPVRIAAAAIRGPFAIDGAMIAVSAQPGSPADRR